MTRRTHLLRLILWMALVLLAVRPVPALERALAAAASVGRPLAELAAPLARLRPTDAHAAGERFYSRSAEDLAQIERLWNDLFELARPSRPELVAGRDLVPGEVVGRVEGDHDRIRVRVADVRGLVPGLPVVHADVYVGRVAAVEAGLCEVDLVTGPRFAVGARLAREGEEPVWMTVGGLAAAGPASPGPGAGGSPRGRRRGGVLDRLALAVRNPSDREPPSGPVEVLELLSDVDPHGDLARGYSLGTLVPGGGGEPVVLADVDYEAGLYHVFVLCPEGTRGPRGTDGTGGGDPEPSPELALADTAWRPARLLSAADPTHGRSGLVVSRGTTDGVREGAAVISGLRLVGRVERAGPWSCDVRTLADPGLSVVAVARVAGDPVPRVLGRLVSEGPLASDPRYVALRWQAIVDVQLAGPRDGRGRVFAELFTGSGEAGMPGGIYLGRALVEAVEGEGPARVLLERAGDAARGGRPWVRVAREARP